MTVRLPGGKSVIVDSKVPLDAYLAAYDAIEDGARDAALDRHAASCARTSTRWRPRPTTPRLDATPEFVVCFIPNDGDLLRGPGPSTRRCSSTARAAAC